MIWCIQYEYEYIRWKPRNWHMRLGSRRDHLKLLVFKMYHVGDNGEWYECTIYTLESSSEAGSIVW